MLEKIAGETGEARPSFGKKSRQRPTKTVATAPFLSTQQRATWIAPGRVRVADLLPGATGIPSPAVSSPNLLLPPPHVDRNRSLFLGMEVLYREQHRPSLEPLRDPENPTGSSVPI